MPSSTSQPASLARPPMRRPRQIPAAALPPEADPIGVNDELMPWPADAQLPCPMCGCTTQGLLDRGAFSRSGEIVVRRTEALPCGCDVTDQAQPLQAAAVRAGYLTLD